MTFISGDPSQPQVYLRTRCIMLVHTLNLPNDDQVPGLAI